MVSLEFKISQVLLNHPSQNDHDLYRRFRDLKRENKDNYSDAEFNREFSDLHPFFCDSESPLLKAFLFNHNQAHNNNPIAKEIAGIYENNGIVVLKNNEMIYVVHCNNKLDTRGQYPIQVSKWILNRGVVGDSIYSNIEDAIKEEGLISREIVSEDDFGPIEDNILKAECSYQERQKAEFGSYCLS